MCRIQVTAWPEGVMISNSSLCSQREHCLPDISVDNMQDRGDLVIQVAHVHRCGCPAPGRDNPITTTSPNRYGNAGEAPKYYALQVPLRTTCDGPAAAACRHLQLVEPRIHASAAPPPPATTFDDIFSKLGIQELQTIPPEDLPQEVPCEVKAVAPTKPRMDGFLKRAVSYSVGRRPGSQRRGVGSCEKTRIFHRATSLSLR